MGVIGGVLGEGVFFVVVVVFCFCFLVVFLFFFFLFCVSDRASVGVRVAFI